MDRRAFLRTSASVGSISSMAGCSALSGSSYTFENAGDDAWETWDFQPQGGRFVAGGRFSLEPGEWTSQGFSSAINILLTYDFEITAGNGVELFVVEADEMENFEERNDPDFRFTDQLDGIGRAATEVTTREYSIVLDNTQFGDKETGENTSTGTLRLEGEPL
jgi:hypothetical protein